MRRNISELSNDDLLSNLHGLVRQGQVMLAQLLAYLGEVEVRRLDLESACSSLFDFCLRRLGMSEDEACRRVAAARLVRQFPLALAMIERGNIHLTGLLMLRDHLTEENHEELLQAVCGKTKSQAQEVIAARFPRQDVPQGPGRVQAISPDRYDVQFTASAELKNKIARAADLMRHQNPRGDLSVIVERALDLLIVELEKRRLGKTDRPRKSPRPKSTRPGHIPRAVRREVFKRDGEQCTFVDEAGRRCEARTLLELEHKHPRALGGTDDADNLCVKCRRHNALKAEQDFGRAHVERKKSEKRASYPRQRGYETQDNVAHRALCGMGFKPRDVERALDAILQRLTRNEPQVEHVLREALSMLTSR